ncbi:DUF4350 domain-containing protein [Brevibacillus aydinogluensis]|jgi:hypothetical protein|uniref:DUF4350 domain-containing protein n=1 Tax=Brevibacillus aydinogluensis TaxID=927786 RepID=A0AA48M7K0_9BACL|nr:DUF4350 domain-containing protein [Brevibacillus aydinogluensis]CAJ1002110.1 DUF4350 domain-containing protein [Brevibacillus aydinogluensis]
MGTVAKYRLALAAAVLLLSVLGWLFINPAAPSYPPYVSFSPQPTGLKAVATLLGEKRSGVKEWRQAWRFLPSGSGQLLIVVEPLQVTDIEREDILRWVESGNDLVVFEKNPTGWEEADLSAVSAGEAGDEAKKERPIYTSIPGQSGTGLVYAHKRLDDTSGMEKLLSDDLGIIAGRTKVGAGTVTLFLVPEWLTNEQVMNHSHFELIWPYLQGDWSVIWLDEYHHGYRQQPGMLAVYPGWLVAALAQLGLVLLFWLWRKGKRFGPVYTLREWTVRRGDETLLAVASWYERRRLTLDALKIREAYLRQVMQERWGLHTRASSAEIAAAARARWSEAEAAALISLLDRIERAKAEGRCSLKQLVAESRMLDDMTERVEKE